ncbi:MAG: rhomboid family intramembrane serine protease [Bacteroidales bacterium]|nr:rhomboid family intramembrane serine protease [Bacteroidales bacterium]
MSDFQNTRLGAFWYNIPPVTRNLVAINVLMFIATLIDEEFMISTFAMFYPTSRWFHPWQILTHMFMHGGFWHIFFNMYTLTMFGIVLERAIGSKKFLVYYFITGLGAVALHTAVQYFQVNIAFSQDNFAAIQRVLSTPTVGASGAIYGILIGYAMMYPDSVLTLLFPPISLKAKWFVLIFAGIELVTGVTGTLDGVAHFAHLGGMLFGWLLMLWWRKTGRIYERDNWI